MRHLILFIFIAIFYSGLAYSEEAKKEAAVAVEVVSTPAPTPAPTVAPVVPEAPSVLPPLKTETEPPQAPWAPPEWLKQILAKAYSVPYVGPVAVEIMKWLGVIASVLTALATAFLAIARSLSGLFRAAKLMEVAAKIDAFYYKWSPYLKFFSMYNVQKEELKKV